MAMKREQRSTRRWQGGQVVEETEGGEVDTTRADVDAATDRARKAMVTGAKPKVSEEEPPKGTIQHLAWLKRQKNRPASDGARALASR